MSGPWERYAAFDLDAALAETDKELGLPEGMSAAQIKVESAGNATARSPAGAMGLAQVMPATLANLSKRLGRDLNPDNERDAVEIHREVMRENLAKFKDPAKALMAYNGGWDPDRWNNPETAAYVGKVQAAMKDGQNPVMGALEKIADGGIPSAQAAEPGKPWTRYASSPVDAGTANPGPWSKFDARTESPKPSGMMDVVKQGAGNLFAGAVRGAGSIGATLLAPIDIASDALDGKGLSLESNKQRRADMDAALQSLGAQPDSWMYQGGKLAGELAGTAGAGGVLANGVRAAAGTRALTGLEPLTNAVAAGLESGGFRVGELAGTKVGAAIRLATGAAAGGTGAALVNPEDAATGAAIGAAFPFAVKGSAAVWDGLGKGMRAVLGQATPEVRELALRAETLGIKIPADRLVDSKTLNALASTLHYVPLSGRTSTEAAMSEQLNKALSRTFGQDTPNITLALRQADVKLGSKFNSFLQNNTVTVDKQFVDDLAQAANQAYNELGAEGASVIGKQVDAILEKGASGALDGQAAYNIKKTLDRIGKRNSPEAWYAIDLKGKLMDALDRSVGEEAAASFSTLRKQYGAMLSLEKLAKNGAEGEISVARLANMNNINNPQIQELADIAAQFVKPREGQHGAAQRAVIGLAGGLVGGIPGVAGGMAAGRAVNQTLNSNAARSAVLGVPRVAATETAALGQLAAGAQRALPVAGAGFLATNANADPVSNTTSPYIELRGMALPDIPPPEPPPPPPADMRSPMQRLGQAETVDEVIAAAEVAASPKLTERERIQAMQQNAARERSLRRAAEIEKIKAMHAARLQFLQ